MRLNIFMESKFSPFLNAYRRHYSCETTLLRLIEEWKAKLDNDINIGIVFNDLSKAFDLVDHNLLISKLHAYGLSLESINLMRSYLSNRSQFVRLNNFISSTALMKVGVPQGSVLGPILFNIFFNDIFYFVNHSYLTAYADDSQIFSYDKNFEAITRNLSSSLSVLKHWFDSNFMQINPSKAKALAISRHSPENISIPFDNTTIDSEGEPVKLLGVWIDSKLNFQHHISKL